MTEAEQAVVIDALTALIRKLVETQRPGTPSEERKLAWQQARTIIEIDDARRAHLAEADHD